MKRSRTPDTAPEDVLSLLTASGPVGTAQAPSLAAPPDDPADRTEFTLDADAWEEWGELARLDDKKAAKIPPGGGWRAHGRQSPQARRCRRRGRRGGYACLHAAVDDYSRVAYVEALDDETAAPPPRFWRRAHDRFWIDDMPVDAVTADNGADFCSGLLAELLARRRIARLRTRAHRPQANGKAQRRLPGCRRGRAET